MMKAFFFSAALAVLFSIAFSAVSRVSYIEGKPGHCYYDVTGAMSMGEAKDIPRQCSRAYCLDNRDMEIHSCGALKAPNVTEYNYDLPYPECCPHAV